MQFNIRCGLYHKMTHHLTKHSTQSLILNAQSIEKVDKARIAIQMPIMTTTGIKNHS